MTGSPSVLCALPGFGATALSSTDVETYNNCTATGDSSPACAAAFQTYLVGLGCLEECQGELAQYTQRNAPCTAATDASMCTAVAITSCDAQPPASVAGVAAGPAAAAPLAATPAAAAVPPPPVAAAPPVSAIAPTAVAPAPVAAPPPVVEVMIPAPASPETGTGGLDVSADPNSSFASPPGSGAAGVGTSALLAVLGGVALCAALL